MRSFTASLFGGTITISTPPQAQGSRFGVHWTDPHHGFVEGKMTFVAEFWKFLSVRKKFWLLPLLVMIGLLGILLVMAESSALAPFIYTLF
jgi:hypothetical protein